MCFQKPPKFPSDVAREQTAAMERIANKQMDLQSEFMDWTRGFLEQNRELQDTVVARQLEQMSQQMEQSDELWSIAKDDRARYEADYLPFEQSLREEAATYATAERKQKEAASAQADVASAFNAARQNEQRRLESYGIDPSQTRARALDRNMQIQEAAAKAAAGTQAADRVDDMGRALRADAINIGRGLPSQVAASYGQSLAGGQGAAGIGGQAIGAANQTMGAGMQGYQAGVGMLGAAGQTYGNANTALNRNYSSRLAQFNATVDPMLLLANTGAQIAGNYIPAGSAPGAAEGGVVPEPAEAGIPAAVPPPGKPTDTMPMKLTPGEFVIPEEVVRWKGEEYFHKQVSQAREKSAEAKQGIPA